MSSTPLQLVIAKLASSGLDARDAKQLGFEALSPAETAKRFPTHKVASLLLPYFDLKGKRRKDVYRVRLLEFPPGAFGQVQEKPLRYLQPEGSVPAAYLPKTIDWTSVIKDVDRTIVITEGELKASCAAKLGLACVGLGGVSSWRSARQGWSLLPELEPLITPGRPIVVCFDSDAATNPNVAAATASLVNTLAARGARPAVAELPEVTGLTKTGLDDFVVALGGQALKDILNNASDDELARQLWEFNGRFAYVMDPGIVFDEQNSGVRFAPYKFRHEAFANVWATQQLLGDGGNTKLKKVCVADEWVKWPLRRQYARVTYAPGEPRVVGSWYNTWPGWACEPKKGDVGPWRQLLDYLFEGAEAEARWWFERWCLYPIYKPGTKLQSAAGLWSRGQGLGKSMIGQTLGKVYGKNYQMINQRLLEEGFNWWAVDKQLVMVDDVSAFDSRSKADLLKTMIIQDELNVNIKHLPQYKVPDRVNYYLTSNHANAFYLEDADRRFFVHEVTADQRPKAFYERVVEWRDNGGPAALLHYAQEELDFKGFDPTARPPMTRAKAEMVASGKGELEAWCAELKADPDSKLRVGKQRLERAVWTPSELVALFDAERKGQPVTSVAMGLKLRAAGFRQVNAGATLKVDGPSERFYAIRDEDKWLKAKSPALLEHIRDWRLRERGGGGKY